MSTTLAVWLDKMVGEFFILLSSSVFHINICASSPPVANNFPEPENLATFTAAS